MNLQEHWIGQAERVWVVTVVCIGRWLKRISVLKTMSITSWGKTEWHRQLPHLVTPTLVTPLSITQLLKYNITCGLRGRMIYDYLCNCGEMLNLASCLLNLVVLACTPSPYFAWLLAGFVLRSVDFMTLTCESWR